MRIRLLPLVAAAALAWIPPLLAQEEPAPPDPLREGIGRAEDAREQGRYGDAEGLYRTLVESGGEGGPPAAHAGLARVLLETGRLPDALREAAAAADGAPADPGILVLLGRIQYETGDLPAAEKTLRRAVAAGPRSAAARTALGDLLRATGRRKEALGVYEEANDLWAARASESPEDLTAVVRARFAIFELDRSVRPELVATGDILAAAIRAGYQPASVVLAEAYARNSQTEKVPNTLRRVFDRNPRNPDALVAGARAKQIRFDSDEAAVMAERALDVDPTHPGAVEILALLRFGDGNDAKALELVRRGLEARPRNRALLSLAAVPACLDGRDEAYEAAVARVLAIDPAYGRAFDFAARVLEDRRRFADAAAMARRAVTVDPRDADGWFSLARNLLNLGQEKEAREALAKASEADPWNDLFRNNFRDVLAELDGYVAGTTEHFRLLIHPEEDAALRPLYAEALEQSFDHFRERYGFTPETPILAEVFRDADSFSARTLGIPGFGAVGACFGKVVTLDSPSALPPGANCWRATEHHEMAHVFHLQMTGGRVPRWFTEGLAVHEETRANASWIRNMYRDLVSALGNDDLKGLEEIDGTFRGPGISWAYFQGGLMCAWIERDFGLPKLLEMIRLYGDGVPNAEVARRALGLDAKAFDAGFRAHCERITAGWRVRPIWNDAKFEEFRTLSTRNADDVEAHLLYGEACLQRGKMLDAGTALARARAKAPEDPRLTELRGLLALRSGAEERGLELLREALEKGQDHFDLRMALGARAEGDGKTEEAVDHYRKAKLWFPRAAGDRDPRRRLERLYNGLGRTEDAVRELEERVAQSETDLEGRMTLAGIYEDRGDDAAAARVLAEMVDIMPIPGRGPRGPSTYPAAEVHARLARAWARQERWGPAADGFARAVVVGRTLEPRLQKEPLAALLVEEAKAARAAGRRVQARFAAEDAVRTDPGNAEAAELLRELVK